MSPRQPSPVPSRLLLVFLPAVVILALSGPVGLAKQPSASRTMQFAADMALRGNWREASYRWQQLIDQGSSDPKLLNNLAVASEAVGDMEQAEEYYERALAVAGGDPSITDNYYRFNRLRDQLRDTPDAADDAMDKLAVDALGNGGKVKGKAALVDVPVPIPPRIELGEMKKLLVAGFLTDQEILLDVKSEMARFLRGELRRRTKLEVLDVVPSPEIPEQTLEDLVDNHEFWKHLGREYGADVIVSGVVTFGRNEVSGFEDVDVVDPQTGQKVRQTQFVEQEEFNYILDLLFMDGATGTVLFRDRLRRTVRFRGLMNDPIHAFYELSESLSNDIVSPVATRMQIETRSIFKR